MSRVGSTRSQTDCEPLMLPAGRCDESRGRGSISALTPLSRQPHCFLPHKPKHCTLTAALDLSKKKLFSANCGYVEVLKTEYQIILGKTDKANVRGRGGTTVLKILQKMLTHSGDTDLLQNRPLGSSLKSGLMQQQILFYSAE